MMSVNQEIGTSVSKKRGYIWCFLPRKGRGWGCGL